MPLRAGKRVFVDTTGTLRHARASAASFPRRVRGYCPLRFPDGGVPRRCSDGGAPGNYGEWVFRKIASGNALREPPESRCRITVAKIPFPPPNAPKVRFGAPNSVSGEPFRHPGVDDPQHLSGLAKRPGDHQPLASGLFTLDPPLRQSYLPAASAISLSM